MEPHQKALVDQAIRLTLTRYDEQHCLLRTTADPRFRAVQESTITLSIALFSLIDKTVLMPLRILIPVWGYSCMN